MTDNQDLFTYICAASSEPAADQYPNHPGARPIDTSQDAAAALAPHLGRLQKLVLDAIEGAGERGLTTDEAASAVNLDRWSVQPRTSELRRLLKIRDSGNRRPNCTGRAAIVWVSSSVTEAAPPARAG